VCVDALHIQVPVCWVKARAQYPLSLWEGSGEDGSEWGPVIDFIQLLKEKGALICKEQIWFFLDNDYANVMEM